MSIGRKDLADLLAKKRDYKKYLILNAIDDIFAEILETLAAGEKVTIQGFGTFETKTYKSHPAVHPETKERIVIPEYKNVVFRPGERLTRAVRGDK